MDSVTALVVLLNFGGPRDSGEVEEFLFEILRDPNTMQLPVPQWLQDRLARFIARRRAPETIRQYGEIGGRSPSVADTDRIARALESALAEAGHPVPVRIAHRYLAGWSASLAAEIAAAEYGRLFALPLYPHFSYATTGSSLEQLEGALRSAGFRGGLLALRSYPDDPGYVAALSERLRECLERHGLSPEGTVVLCSAHGLPVANVERGDPYPRELERTLGRLRERFPEWRIELSFQSRVGPAEWRKPYTDAFVPLLAEQGVRQLVFVPISFVNDHIETIYEVGHTYFDLARRCGIEPYRCDAVSDHPDHIRTLCEAVRRWQDTGWGVSPVELLPPSQAFRRRWAWLLAAGLLGAAAVALVVAWLAAA